ncbi:MAG TPA: M28 family peptidase [Candidatus Baltobacteraceae bacterium]|jgi:N-acetylated-alpha-linked acidic dipeptidase|nr:M28 family peptidase [Candidatus Baltobacteraceae bacterium]
MKLLARRSCALLVCALIAPIPSLAQQSSAGIIGWASGPAVAQELQFEHTMMSVPSSANAMEIETHLSSVPHRAGSAADVATANYVRDRLTKDGFSTRFVKYDVWFTGPVSQTLDLVAPRHESIDLLEGTPGAHTKWERMAGPPFLENSGDGDVTGPVYYVNAAAKDDLADLDAEHVNLNGAVVIVRLSAPGGGGLPRSFDPKYNAYNELRKRGVAAILEFMDPATQGYGGGTTWPAGNFKNMNMAERMGGMAPGSFTNNPPGDPTMPGKAPVVGAAHLPYDQVPHATIPELSITMRVARMLLSGLHGPVVGTDWHPMFEFVQHVGDGSEKVHVHTKFTRHLVTIYNVLGEIKGSTNPGSIVMIGSHRDAMTFGAIDPGSGTTVMLQDADAFHKLLQQGWRPQRTIQIMSWDGHELGLYGSASYIYENGEQLRSSVFQYINTDQLTTGDPYVVSASPGLYAFNKQIADIVPGPDGRPLSARDQSKRPLLNPITGGSDHQNFAYILGVPSTSNGFYGFFGAHHTAEDNIDGLRTYDPGLKEAVACAQVTGIQAMRAAGATVSPLRIAEIPEQLLKDVPMIAGATMGKANLAPLTSALASYETSAKAMDEQMAKAEAAGDASAMKSLAAKEEDARAAFFAPDGLAFNKFYHTFDRVFVSYPEILFAGNDPIALQAAIDRAAAAAKTAAAALGTATASAGGSTQPQGK